MWAEADVLFNLDCCHAAFKSSYDTFGRTKEVLAARTIRGKAVGVEANDFTRAIMWVLNGCCLSSHCQYAARKTPQ